MNNPLHSQQHMPNVTASGQVMSNGSKNYAPSVPISVYRELAEQMQANQKRVEFLKAENQQLTRQNQQLRQEIQKLVESAIYLQQVANSFEPVTTPPIVQKREPVPFGSAMGPPGATELPPVLVDPASNALKDKTLLTEREEGRYRRPSPPEAASEVSGIWLAVAIFLIVIFAFGAGFLIVRPLSGRR